MTEEPISVDQNKLSGNEMIEFEEITGLFFAQEMAAWARDEKSAKAVLGITYLWRRRTNPDLTWEDHRAVDIDISVGLEEEDADPK